MDSEESTGLNDSAVFSKPKEFAAKPGNHVPTHGFELPKPVVHENAGVMRSYPGPVLFDASSDEDEDEDDYDSDAYGNSVTLGRSPTLARGARASSRAVSVPASWTKEWASIGLEEKEDFAFAFGEHARLGGLRRPESGAGDGTLGDALGEDGDVGDGGEDAYHGQM